MCLLYGCRRSFCKIFEIFFFKQKTSYEMRISDWSSDVCSSDLPVPSPLQLAGEPASFVIGATGLRSPPPACGRGFSGSLRRDAGLGEHVLAVAFGVVHRRGVVAGLVLLAAVEAGPPRVPVAARGPLAVLGRWRLHNVGVGAPGEP